MTLAIICVCHNLNMLKAQVSERFTIVPSKDGPNRTFRYVSVAAISWVGRSGFFFCVKITEILLCNLKFDFAVKEYGLIKFRVLS